MRQMVSGTLVVGGQPAARIKVSPSSRRLSLLVQRRPDDLEPDLVARANLTYSVAREAGEMWHSLDVVVDDNLSEVYPVLCTIADKVQLGRDSFGAAVHSVLSGLADILAGRKGLSREEQTGLFGELTVLLSLVRSVGAVPAIASWRGPAGEEHDFGLEDIDLEVKTTTSERRRHWITNLMQLTPTNGRTLHLLSLQLTAAGSGPGASLPELVEAVRSLPDVSPTKLDTLIADTGWRDWHADAYKDRWRLRSEPAFYRVDDSFPALTTARVAAVMPASERLTDMHYRVDVTGIGEVPPTFPVVLLVDGGAR